MPKKDHFIVSPAFPTERKEGVNLLGFFAAHVAAGVTARTGLNMDYERFAEAVFDRAEMLVAEYVKRTEASESIVTEEQADQTETFVREHYGRYQGEE